VAFAFTGSWFTGVATTGTAVSIGPLSLASGELMILLVACKPTNLTVSSITDTAGNVYFSCGAVDSSSYRTELFYVKNAIGNAANTTTVTMTGTVTDLNVSMMKFSGGATIAPFDRSSTGHAASGTAWSASSLDPAGPNELSVSFAVAATTPFTGTAGGTYTVADNNGNMWGEYILSTSSAQTGAWTSNVNEAWQVVQAFFSTTDIVQPTTSALKIANILNATNSSLGAAKLPIGPYSVRSDQVLVSVVSQGPTTTISGVAENTASPPQGGKITWYNINTVDNATTSVIWVGIPNNSLTNVTTEYTGDGSTTDVLFSLYFIDGASTKLKANGTPVCVGNNITAQSGVGAAQVTLNAATRGSLLIGTIGDGTSTSPQIAASTNTTRDFLYLPADQFASVHLADLTTTMGNVTFGSSAPTGHNWTMAAVEILQDWYKETEIQSALFGAVPPPISFQAIMAGRGTFIISPPTFNILDFTTGSNEASFTVIGQSGILSNSHIEAWIQSEPYGDGVHSAADQMYAAQSISLTCGNIIPGVGFTIYGRCLDKMQGRFKVRWFWV
jgi:hypothetical protein